MTLHTFSFVLSAGAWVEGIGYANSADQLVRAVETSTIYKHQVTLSVRYQSSGMDKRPFRGGRLVEVGTPTVVRHDNIARWAQIVWGNAVADYHNSLGFPCACTKETE